MLFRSIPSTVRMADYSNTLDYFAALKTPALTASGKPKDRFHFTYTTAEWDALTTAGEEVGYGLTWSRNSASAPSSARSGRSDSRVLSDAKSRRRRSTTDGRG